jgi:hypothetical protein
MFEKFIFVIHRIVYGSGVDPDSMGLLIRNPNRGQRKRNKFLSANISITKEIVLTAGTGAMINICYLTKSASDLDF